MDNVECPFCGVSFEAPNAYTAIHPEAICPLSKQPLSPVQWNMRPHKKEQPTTTASQSEVEWLRCIVETLVETRVPNYHVSYDNKDLAEEIK